MAVSNYLAKSEYGCRYHYDKLKDVIYLVSESHLKFINIDNGEANISGLTESPLKITGFNIEFKEETSLDERYKFQKSLTISVNGYSTFEDLNEKYYAIIEAKDKTFYMVNVDFPSKITHTYNLSKDTNQTTFTFSSVSNFPALKLNGFNPNNAVSCKSYLITGIDGLKMLESAKTELKETENKVLATEEFKTVEYLGESLTFQESYDGDKYTTTLEFQIAFDAYKTSWHYNLLEFIMNRYAAIIGIKNSSNKIYTGFKEGLQPNYSIESSNGKDKSDIVTITLVETANKGLTVGDFAIEINSAKHWRYVRQVGNIKGYECIDGGVSKYLLQEESDYFGNPTGNYKVLEGYAALFSSLNIVGTFSEEVTFYNPNCSYEGVEKYRWVSIPITEDYICYNCPEPSYRWVTVSGGYECSGTTKMTQEKKQVSYGVGWSDVIPLETRIGSTVIQYNSTDCGYIPPAPAFNGKWEITIFDKITGNIRVIASAVCDSTSAITLNEVTGKYLEGDDYISKLEIGNCVKELSRDSLYGYYSLESVTIPNSVTTIGYEAFRFCSGLTSVTIPDSVTSMDEWVFDGCTNLANVTIGNGVTTIDNCAFRDCRGLTNITIGSSVTSISGGSFYGCTSLPNIVIPDNVIEIEGGAFGSETSTTRVLVSLTGVTIGSGATSVSDGAFTGAPNIKSVNLNMPNINRCFSGHTNILTATFGDNVSSLGYGAFKKCSSLTKVTIPSGITTIGNSAFSGCSSLLYVKCDSTTPPTLDYYPNSCDVFHGTNDCPIFVPCASLDAYKTASGWSVYENRITCIESANTLAILELNNGSVDEYITPKNVIDVKFEKAYSSTCINAQVTTACTSIGNSAFTNCISLASVTIGNGVTTIGNSVFKNCSGLTSIEIPDSVTSIGNDAFYECRSLTGVTIPIRVSSIENYTFTNCISLNNATIGNAVTNIDKYAFLNCTSLTSIDIPSGVTRIGEYAFGNCTGLTSITIEATTPPILSSYGQFYNTSDCPIYVPAASVDTYKAASGWSEYASRIQAIQ